MSGQTAEKKNILTDVFKVAAGRKNRFMDSSRLISYLPTIKLDKFFDTTTMEHHIAPDETSKFYKDSVEHFYANIETGLQPALSSIPSEATANDKDLIEYVVDNLYKIEPEKILLSIPQELKRSLRIQRAELTGDKGLTEFSSECENMKDGYLTGLVLDRQWDLTYKLHNDLCDHVKRLGNGYSADQVLKGKGKSLLHKAWDKIFYKTPERPRTFTQKTKQNTTNTHNNNAGISP